MKKIYCLLTAICLLTEVSAQPDYAASRLYVLDTLRDRYLNNNIDKQTYLDSVTAKLNNHILIGGLDSKSGLLHSLQLYKKLAWSSDKLKKYRLEYYHLLANNARMQNRGGEALYYFEKLEQEYKRQGKDGTLYVLQEKCYLHTRNSSYTKAVQNYEQAASYIREIPERVREGTIDIENAMSAFYALSPVASSYIQLRDTLKTDQIIDLANSIKDEVFKKISPQSEQGTVIRFLITGMYYFKYKVLLKDFKRTQKTLKELYTIIYGTAGLSEEWRIHLGENYVDWAADYYLEVGNNDSAAFQIKQMNSFPNPGIDQRLRLNEYKAWLGANKGLTDSVYPVMHLALKQKDSMLSDIMTEMDDLLYAFTQAENDRNDLLIAEKGKRNRNRAIVAISIAAILIIGGIYQQTSKKSREAKRKIAELDRIANLQIAELEEIKWEERREEQKRLGRELHDDLSGSIASVKIQLEIIERDTKLEQLQAVKSQLDSIYDKVRNKSHEWAWQDDSEAGKSFEERIKALLKTTLPETHYKKQINVEDTSIARLSVEEKIQLLRIIQEAVTNILKHAQASEVDILLYNEDQTAILYIKDNGHGFDPTLNKTKCLGLQSIQDRARKLNGFLSIQSDSSGTQLTVTLQQTLAT